MTDEQILNRVFAAYGSKRKAAAALGVTRQALQAWSRVPMQHVRQVAKDTGLPKWKLRPDIYERADR